MSPVKVSPRPSRRVDPERAPRPLPADDTGMPDTLRAVAERMAQVESAKEAVDVGLTLDGRVPLEVGVLSLSTQEAARYDALGAAPAADGDLPRAGSPTFALALRTDGRVLLSGPVASTAGGGAAAADLVAPPRVIPVTPEVVASFDAAHTRAEAARAHDDERVARWLGRLDEDQRHELLEELQYASAHGAPLVFYVEDAVYSNFRFVNNLAGKSLLPTSEECLFRQLADRPPDDWARNERSFVYAAAALLRMGGPAGLEECSGMQLMPAVLRRFLEQRARQYGLDVDPGADDWTLAEALAGARDRMRAERAPYRRIYGINGNKREHYFDRQALTLAQRRVLARLPAPGGSWPGDPPGSDREWEAALDAWIPSVVDAGEADDAAEAPIPRAIAALVSQVRDEAGADIAMSRGVRSLGALAAAVREEDWDRIVDWEQPNYYCCVLPSSQLLERFRNEPEELADVLWSIAARMEYNVWHSLPDNLPRTEHVRRRDYVYAQRFPDLAEWSDQHHRGHVIAGVRYSIRAPGAVELVGRRFHALTDIRLMRQSGPAFGVAELALAAAAARLMAILVERLASAIVRLGRDHRIDAFDSGWYTRRFIRERVAVPNDSGARA